MPSYVVSAILWHLFSLRLCSCRVVSSFDGRQVTQPGSFGQDALASPYLNNISSKFLVNGTNFPRVSFDIGESYAGLLPISPNTTDPNQLYFWFFPSDNPDAGDEITIWLNGGPGCSSLIGLFQENGKFLWQPGTAEPVQNPWAWTKLTNVVWIDQPVGAGFAQGTPSALGSDGLAPQFMGFWRNFVDTFNLQGRKVFFTGESYAGTYIPYFASAFLDSGDLEYFNVQGTMLIDPSISYDVALVEIPMLNFVEANQGLLQLNESFQNEIRQIHNDSGYTTFFNDYNKFPTSGHMPTPPNDNETDSPFRSLVADAAQLYNPCLNIYHITDTCPTKYDPIDTLDPAQPEAGGFFNLTEVKAAMHAPQVSYSTCSSTPVYAGTGSDQARPVSITVLPGVFDRVPINIVANGALDMLIPSVGTLFALQNVSWQGTVGFTAPPTAKFVLPAAPTATDEGSQSPLGPSGEMGTWAYERGVLFADVKGAGHELPEHNPSAAFRLLEVLLGRVGVDEGMGGGAGWTVQPGV